MIVLHLKKYSHFPHIFGSEKKVLKLRIWQWLMTSLKGLKYFKSSYLSRDIIILQINLCRIMLAACIEQKYNPAHGITETSQSYKSESNPLSTSLIYVDFIQWNPFFRPFFTFFRHKKEKKLPRCSTDLDCWILTNFS